MNIVVTGMSSAAPANELRCFVYTFIASNKSKKDLLAIAFMERILQEAQVALGIDYDHCKECGAVPCDGGFHDIAGLHESPDAQGLELSHP